MQNKQTLSKPLVVMLLAGLCCLLWGSAIPFINLGYRYFDVSAGDTATQILFGGCRFFLAGFLTIRQQSREILLMRTMGMPPARIFAVYFAEQTAVSLSGCAIGGAVYIYKRYDRE